MHVEQYNNISHKDGVARCEVNKTIEYKVDPVTFDVNMLCVVAIAIMSGLLFFT